MRKRETAEITMYAIMANFLTTNKAQFANYDRLNIEITTFTGLHLILLPLLAKHAANITGITADKNAAFTNLGKLIKAIASKASVFAEDNNNQTLAAIVNFTNSDFKYQSHTKKLIQAQGITNEINPFVPAMADYHIFDTHIEAINNLITTSNRLVIATREAITGKKAATTAIKKLMVRLNTSLTVIENLIASEYDRSNPDLLLGYQINRRVAGKGIRYTGLSASFTDASTGKRIEHAEISIPKIKKTAISNSKGLAQIVKMTAGIFKVHCSATGYVAQVVDVKMSRGRIVKIEVGMVVV